MPGKPHSLPSAVYQAFTADFFIMTQSLSQLLNDLLNLFAEVGKSNSNENNSIVNKHPPSPALAV